MIRKDLIPEEYYTGSESCPDCSAKLPRDSQETYKRKEKEIVLLRRKAAEVPFHTGSYENLLKEEEIQDYTQLLKEDGTFCDLQNNPAGARTAIGRLAVIADGYHKYRKTAWSKDLKLMVLKASAHYCKIEADRPDRGNSRFHDSIFYFPVCAMNLFLNFLEDMEQFEAYESGEAEFVSDMPLALVREAYTQFLRIALQTFTLPERGDHTDRHPISVERFRKHVWWVGGNAIGYRHVYQAALVLRSVECLNVVAEVARGALTPVSAATIDDAFWTEGICADGFGWGHGRQSYVLGYAYDGSYTALHILDALRETAWDEKVDWRWLFELLRGISWNGYHGCTAPMQTRNIFHRGTTWQLDKPKACSEQYAKNLAQIMKDCFSDRMTEEERREVDAILGTEYLENIPLPEKCYRGVRAFFNNDALIAKKDGLYFYVNMASARTDGVEFAAPGADMRNYFFGDGSYVLMQKGDEYEEAKGTWQVSHLPGVTERDLRNEELIPEVNWTGYHSLHNFAALVCRGGCGAAGFLYEKDPARTKDGAGKLRDHYTKEMMGIFAAKSYFVIEDTIVCLGAGITDKNPEYGHDVVTTINNTLKREEPRRITSEGHEDRDYIVHDGVLYSVRRQENHALYMAAEKRMTHWLELNGSSKGVEDCSVPVFELGICHGSAPVEDSYEYYMYCGREEPEQYIREHEPVVLCNQTGVQAVAACDFSYIAAVFSDSNEAVSERGVYLSMDYPGAVMLQREGGNVYITVCDGIQLEKRKEITVSYKFPEDDSVHTRTIKLPEGVLTGKEITVLLEGKQCDECRQKEKTD